MHTCPLCGERTLPIIRVPGIQFIGGSLIYNNNFIRAFDPRSNLCAFIEIVLRWWPSYVSRERCIFYIWQGDETPTADRALGAMAHYIRKRIRPTDIRGSRGMGFKFFLPDEGVLSERTTVELRIQHEAHHATHQSS